MRSRPGRRAQAMSPGFYPELRASASTGWELLAPYSRLRYSFKDPRKNAAACRPFERSNTTAAPSRRCS